MLSKIVSNINMRRWDDYTIKTQQITSLELMEKAALAFCTWFMANYVNHQTITIFCGKGNNGGDGFAIARKLHLAQYQVTVYALSFENLSKDTLINFKKLQQANVDVFDLTNAQTPISFGDVVIDALLGTGLNKPLTGNLLKLVNLINQQLLPTIAVDVPSGLFTDAPQTGIAIKASTTIAFERPKKAFFFPESYSYVGHWIAVTIGLTPAYESQIQENWFLIDDAWILENAILRKKIDHKGTYGHAIIIAGSKGKFGASVLAAKAALKAGCGLVSVGSHQEIGEWFHAAFPEAMIIPSIDFLNTIHDKAISIGPGLGISHNALALFTEILNTEKPMVIDADAINMLSKNPKLLKLIPKQSILTPHPKELERLIGSFPNWKTQLDYLINWCHEHEIILVCKNAHTFIISPERQVFVNNTGCNGMATAGSGDVLTGIITSMLAQGYEPLQAAIRGVFYHGKAGELASKNHSLQGCTASDIINHIGPAYLKVN